MSAPWWYDPAARDAHQHRRDEDVVVSELIPAEWAGIELSERLAHAVGRVLIVTVCDGRTWSGPVAEVGSGWFTLQAPDAAQVLIRMAAVAAVRGLPPRAQRSASGARPSQATVFRQWARERRRVRVSTTAGTVLEGTVVRVGIDHVDIVEHAVDRRPLATDGGTSVPMSAVLWSSARC